MPTLGEVSVNSEASSPLQGRNGLMFKKIGQTRSIYGPFSKDTVVRIKQRTSIIAVTLGIAIELSLEIVPFSVNLITNLSDNLSIVIDRGNVNVKSLKSIIVIDNTNDAIVGSGSIPIPQSGTLSMSSTLYLLDEPINEFYVQILPPGHTPVNPTIYLDVFKEGLSI